MSRAQLIRNDQLDVLGSAFAKKRAKIARHY